MSLTATRCQQACPFCGRKHWFHIDSQLPVQKFDLHRDTVTVTVRVLRHDGPFLICEWDWDLHDHRRGYVPA